MTTGTTTAFWAERLGDAPAVVAPTGTRSWRELDGEANRLARVAQDGLALSIRPAHTSLDGDTLFALSLGQRTADFDGLCLAAVEVVSRAIVNAVLREA